MSYKFLLCKQLYFGGFLGGSIVKKKKKNPSSIEETKETWVQGDMGSISGFGKSPRGGNGNSLQYSCRENPMDREGWRAIVYAVAKNWTGLATEHTHTQAILFIG